MRPYTAEMPPGGAPYSSCQLLQLADSILPQNLLDLAVIEKGILSKTIAYAFRRLHFTYTVTTFFVGHAESEEGSEIIDALAGTCLTENRKIWESRESTQVKLARLSLDQELTEANSRLREGKPQTPAHSCAYSPKGEFID